ncbi:biotin transporter BioY [Arcanobacterium hippocoleae]
MTMQKGFASPSALTKLRIASWAPLREAAASAAIVALLAQIVIPLKPIPVTGQTLAVVLVGLLAHHKSAAGGLAIYASLAALGAPILSGGTSGIGASFGFVLGFIAAAYTVSRLTAKGLHGWRAIAIPAIGLAIPYLPGLIWLGGFLASNGMFSFSTLLTAGVTPFLIGDAIKLAIASSFALLIADKSPESAA